MRRSLSLRDLPIHAKLWLVVLAATTVGLVFGSVGIIIREVRSAQRETASRLEGLSAMVAKNVAAAVSFSDTTTVEETLKTLEKEPRVALAAVYALEGAAIASYSRDGKKPPDKAPEAGSLKASRDRLLRLEPILENGTPIGSLLIEAELGLRTRIRSYAIIVALALIAAALTSVPMVGQMRRMVADPLVAAVGLASEVARGNLTVEIETGGADEVGQLSRSLRKMTADLRELIQQVGEASNRVSGSSQAISGQVVNVARRASEEQTLVSKAHGSLSELDETIQAIGASIHTLDNSAGHVRQASEAVASEASQVSETVESLVGFVERVSGATAELAGAMEAIDGSVQTLVGVATDTSASMTEMDATIKAVDQNIRTSLSLSNQAREDAENGIAAARAVLDGMGDLRRGFDETSRAIRDLTDRGREIGKIVGVIDDIAEQTNLLALNAAILAAQAGSQGNGFSVVAGEIRMLSERTASSTAEINALVGSVRDGGEQALRTMASASTLVSDSVERSKAAGEMLGRIAESSNRATDVVAEISRAVQEQSKSSAIVVEGVQRVSEMVTRVRDATGLHAAGSGRIIATVGEMRAATKVVARAADQQQLRTREVNQSVQSIVELVSQIVGLTGRQTGEAGKMVGLMNSVRQLSRENEESVAQMRASLEDLARQAALVEDRVKLFQS